MNAMVIQGRAESWLINNLSDQGLHPSLNHEEAPPAVTWQLLLAAKQADALVSHFTRQILGLDQDVTINADECADEFKVLSSQYRYLSVTEAGESEVPTGLLFYKDSRIVALTAICSQLIADAHGTGHVGITKTYNGVRALYWWPALWSDVEKAVDRCQACMEG